MTRRMIVYLLATLVALGLAAAPAQATSTSAPTVVATWSSDERAFLAGIRRTWPDFYYTWTNRSFVGAGWAYCERRWSGESKPMAAINIGRYDRWWPYNMKARAKIAVAAESELCW